MESSFLIEADNTSILRTGALHCYHYYRLSTGYRPLGSCPPPRSGLERSDFVLWAFRDLPTDGHNVCC